MNLGIDAGNYMVKIVGEYGILNFNSAIGESRKINLQQTHGKDDMIFNYNGESGFAGTLALYESEFGGSIMGTNKAHYDTKIRVLIGIHRYATVYNINETKFNIVVGQPISTHNTEEKNKIKNMLKGWHIITVNGVEKTFQIRNVEVAAEGISAFWSNWNNSTEKGLVRIIDVGSGTVNYSTILEQRKIDKDSDTLTFGANTNKSNSLSSLARGIATHTLKKWNRNDKTFVVGGVSEKILPHLGNYFSNIEVLYPIFKKQTISPIFANAVSFYVIGVNIYE